MGFSVSGEIVLLEDNAEGRIASYIALLDKLPKEPRWILVGGLAVNVRFGRIHRATNDIDTVSSDQPRFVEILVDLASTTERLSQGKVQFHNPDVEVDVMDSTESQNLTGSASDRAFALARRFAMKTATTVEIGAVDATSRVVQRTEILVASPPALVTLKSVSIPRRVDGHYPEKVGSDIQDLLRLVEGQDLDMLVKKVRDGGSDLADWVGAFLSETFSLGSDNLRYSMARLRRLANNIDASSITEESLSLLGEFGDILRQNE